MFNFSEMLGLNTGKTVANAGKSETMTPAERSLWQNLNKARKEIAQPQDKFLRGLQPSKASLAEPQVTNKQVTSERSGLHVSDRPQPLDTSHANSEAASSNASSQIPERYTTHQQQVPRQPADGANSEKPPSYDEAIQQSEPPFKFLPGNLPGTNTEARAELSTTRSDRELVELPGHHIHGKKAELSAAIDSPVYELPGSEGHLFSNGKPSIH